MVEVLWVGCTKESAKESTRLHIPYTPHTRRQRSYKAYQEREKERRWRERKKE